MLNSARGGNRMKYSIRELSNLAGVSARTLRYYDEIGLLKPLDVSEAGYRYYGEKEVELLQQILFYRERGFDLKSIQKILYQDDFDIIKALEEHLLELEGQRDYTNSLIRTVKQTILSMKGEYEMSDKEKFEAFKEKIVRENEEKYGAEVRKKHGDEEMDASNKKVMNMSEKEWEHFEYLETEIRNCLKDAVTSGTPTESKEAEKIVLLHKEWLEMTWKKYTKEPHKALAAAYISDERFRMYYDKEVEGCAKFLEQAIRYWVDKQ